MIKVHFFDWKSGDLLDIEKELGIEIEVDAFLSQNVQGIELEATDNEMDMENNQIYWFSADNESKSASEIERLLAGIKKKSHRLNYTVTIAEL